MSSDNLCYQTHYNDAYYTALGFTEGACPFQKVLSKMTSKVCNGHSDENTKYCPDSVVTITVYKMGKGSAEFTLEDEVVQPPPPQQPWYHQMSSDNLCYQTHYNDAHYTAMGYTAGPCPFQVKLASTTVQVCNGHSDENLKYCPGSAVTITVLKMGEGGGNLRGSVPQLLADMTIMTAPQDQTDDDIYHLGADKTNCFETSYHDAHYATLGYTAGPCGKGAVLDKNVVKVCDGHSDVNLKYCTTKVVSIAVYKMGTK